MREYILSLYHLFERLLSDSIKTIDFIFIDKGKLFKNWLLIAFN